MSKASTNTIVKNIKHYSEWRYFNKSMVFLKQTININNWCEEEKKKENKNYQRTFNKKQLITYKQVGCELKLWVTQCYKYPTILYYMM